MEIDVPGPNSLSVKRRGEPFFTHSPALTGAAAFLNGWLAKKEERKKRRRANNFCRKVEHLEAPSPSSLPRPFPPTIAAAFAISTSSTSSYGLLTEEEVAPDFQELKCSSFALPAIPHAHVYQCYEKEFCLRKNRPGHLVRVCILGVAADCEETSILLLPRAPGSI